MSGSHDFTDESIRGLKATASQQAGARRRAMASGRSFAQLVSVGQASEEIEALQKAEVLSRSDRRREDDDIARAMAEEFGGATAFREDETGGYGGDAHWT